MLAHRINKEKNIEKLGKLCFHSPTYRAGGDARADGRARGEMRGRGGKGKGAGWGRH